MDYKYKHQPPSSSPPRWLEMKTMLVRKNRKVAMKSKRRWRRYWGKDHVGRRKKAKREGGKGKEGEDY